MLLWLLLVLNGSAALAQSEADRATARSLAAEGYRALQEEDFETAEDRFRRADALVHAPTLVVDHARALVGLGRLVEAHERYELVLREGVASDAPWVWKRALDDAEAELAALKPRLAWVVLRVSGPATPEVTIDGNEVPRAALGVPRATNPGTRTIEAAGPGYLPETNEVTLAEGEEREIMMTLERAPQAEESRAAEPMEASTPTPEPDEPKELGTSRRTWMYVSLGVGGAGLLGGGAAGVVAYTKSKDLDDACPTRDRCSPNLQDDIDSYDRWRIATGVGLGIGVVGLAAGAYLYFTDPVPGDAALDSASILPLVSHDTLGVWGRF